MKEKKRLDKAPVKGKFAKGHEKKRYAAKPKGKQQNEKAPSSGLIRLNKYLADAGICSRREADVLIASGAVMINGKVANELGTKVNPTDKVQYGGETLRREKHRYLLLNKPKGFITTSDDPQNRRTVMQLVDKACNERIYPVGRLDRNTTGLLLFTNDGDLAKKLTHPNHNVKKIYHVVLDKSMAKKDMLQMVDGIELEDGFVQADQVSYVAEVNDKKQIGVELHSGRNRVIRRIFEHLGYKVVKLDRVFFAGLTKKDILRGKWRFLSPKEVNMLQRIK